jgi:hypothetical protein
MKLLFITLVLGLSFFAQASVQYPDGYSKVADERMDDYKKAIRLALSQNPGVIANSCSQSWIYNVIEYAGDILVSDTAIQPLLVFNAFYDVGNSSIHRMVVTTDDSLQNITAINIEVYRMEEVNTGDLANPLFTEGYVLKSYHSCTPANP